MKLPVKYTEIPINKKYLVREEYIRQQKGCCYYCGGLLDKNPPLEIQQKVVTPDLYPENFFDHPLHLHHDRNTDMTIGVVHARCNAVLWEYHNE